MSTTEPTDKSDSPSTDAEHAETYGQLTGFQRDILVVLYAADRDDRVEYGLSIKDELEELLGEVVNHGRLYPNLDQLINQDLIEKSEIDKRTNQYEITEYGVTVLDAYGEWTRSLVEGDRR